MKRSIPSIDKRIVEKWTRGVPRGLSVANIEDKTIRENMAQLLENQVKAEKDSLMTETFGIGVGAPLGADQGIPHGGDAKAAFAPVTTALVRRVFPQLFANVLVGVQPMQSFVGLAYAMRFIYNDTANPEKIVEAGWKAVSEYSGYSGSQANTSGAPDSGIGVDTQGAEGWSVNDVHGNGKIPELGMTFQMTPIVARTRKLAASFSLESIKDIQSAQNVDLVKEMVNMLQYELTAELDRETIGRVKAICTRKVLTASVSDDQWAGRYSRERLSGVITHIIGASNDIAVATRRAPGNIAVVSPAVATALQSATAFYNRVEANVNGSTATPEVGSLNGGAIKVYRDNYAVDSRTNFDNEEVLVAFKGASKDVAGVIYCPYESAVVNQAIDPNNFSPRIGIHTRYAFVNNLLGADNYYRLLQFKGISGKITGDTY